MVFFPGWVLKECPGVSRQEGPSRRGGFVGMKVLLVGRRLTGLREIGVGLKDWLRREKLEKESRDIKIKEL